MNATPHFQHLINPETCARCGSCEAECEVLAISHDERNFVIDAQTCSSCRACIDVCPTGAIDSWFDVGDNAAFPIADQLIWDTLPGTVVSADDIGEILDAVSVAAGVTAPAIVAKAPSSAAAPTINLFSAHAPATATVIENCELTARGDVRHIVLDFGAETLSVLEGQTIGIIAPGTDATGRAHVMRAYSVASAREGELPGTQTFALTVKRITEDHAGNPARGVCSNHLCDCAIGARVEVIGPFGETFLAPNAPGAKMLMICTGTGIAPMRGFIQQRQRHPLSEDGCDMMLFYGARTPAEMPYFDDLIGLPHSLLDLNLAFSRAPDQPREYVQDLLLKREQRVASWLRDENSYLYLCGVRGMEEGVEQAFAQICTPYGIEWPQLKQKLREQGRWHVEVY